MSVRIADLPASERPRERLARLGPGGLSDQELLALVIRSGSRGASAMDVGTDLLGAWGSLNQLSAAGMDDLDGVLSPGSAKAAGIVGLRFLDHIVVAGSEHRSVLASCRSA